MISAQKKKIKDYSISVLFLLLSVLLIVSLFKFGIPLIIEVTSFVFSLNKSNQTVENTAVILPPLIYSEFESTNSANLLLKGKPSDDGSIIIYGNGVEIKKIDSLKNKEFTTEITLTEGENSFYAVQENEKNNRSLPSAGFSVTLDTASPDLNINQPEDKSRFFGLKQKKVKIEGKTESEALVLINQHQVILKNDGSFTYSFDLQDGENQIKIQSQDQAGNINEKELILFYTP